MPIPIPFLLGLTLGAGAVVAYNNPKFARCKKKAKNAVKKGAATAAKKTADASYCIAEKLSKDGENE